MHMQLVFTFDDPFPSKLLNMYLRGFSISERRLINLSSGDGTVLEMSQKQRLIHAKCACQV